MTKKKEARERATLASKIAGKEKRWHRDLRGRFRRASEQSRSPGDFSKEGKKSIRKIRPSTLSAVRDRSRKASKRIRIKK